MYSKEDLEDLSMNFSADYDSELEVFEDHMIEATRNLDYDSFMTVFNKLKAFCFSKGEGGKHYFDNMYRDDPRISTLKQIKEGPIYKDVVTMLRERGPSQSKDIYLLVEEADNKLLQALTRKKEILRISGTHYYYLPDQDVSGIVEKLHRKDEDLRKIAEEYEKDGSPGITMPSTEEVTELLMQRYEEHLREEGLTEKQIDTVMGRKKKQGFLSFFRRNKKER